jgi:hypothetical protein
MTDGVALRKENCEKAAAAPSRGQKTALNECVLKSELIDVDNRIVNKVVADDEKKGIKTSEESHQRLLKELYGLGEKTRLVIENAEDCPAGRSLWHPPKKLK